jgi:hypothetical protein
MRKHQNQISTSTETLQRLQGAPGGKRGGGGTEGHDGVKLDVVPCPALLVLPKNASCCPLQRHTTATPWRRIRHPWLWNCSGQL